jgi:magnesium chelatase family protein
MRTGLRPNETGLYRCGHYGDPKKECRCNQIQVQRYLSKVSGPLLDRIDLRVEVPHVPYDELSSDRSGPTSAEVREKVVAARVFQQRRFAGTSTFCNAAMTERQVQDVCKVDAEGGVLLKNAVDTLGFSARSYGRILKVARTIADLEAQETMSAAHISEAIQYRNLDRYKEL